MRDYAVSPAIVTTWASTLGSPQARICLAFRHSRCVHGRSQAAMLALCCLVQLHIGLDHSVGTNLSAVRDNIGVTRGQMVHNGTSTFWTQSWFIIRE
jgi:hypothetical protein